MQKASMSKKVEQVQDLQNKIERAVTVVAFDFPGLTVDEFTKLRGKLREADCEVAVYKNNISRRASVAAGYEGLADVLVGPKALAMSFSDVVAPAKIIYEFAKNNDKVVMQAGIVEGKIADIVLLNQLATLPSRETLLTMLAVGMLTPIKELAIGLNMISEEA
ncbi:MAG: 50S ribosomal protein L10 [Acholeplasmataceae bacterium]